MIIGIDPGKHGAFAFYNSNGVGIFSLLEDIDDARKFICHHILQCRTWPSQHIFVEQVSASPQMGVVSAFSFGRRFEMILSICAGLNMEYKLVRPQVWQNAIGVLSGGDKGRLFEKAKELYPNVKFNRSQADALLIMHYGRKVVENG